MTKAIHSFPSRLLSMHKHVKRLYGEKRARDMQREREKNETEMDREGERMRDGERE